MSASGGLVSPLKQQAAAEPKKSVTRKLEPKRSVPKIPKTRTVASKKLKQFHGMSSPMKKSGPSISALKGKKSSDKNFVPQNEEEKTTKSKEVKSKASMPKDGEEEPRISPDTPA